MISYLFFVFGIISGIGVGCDFTNVDTSGSLFSPIWFLYHFLIKKFMVSCCVSSTKIVGPLGPGRSVSSTIILAPWALDAAFRQLKLSAYWALDVAFRQLKSSRFEPWT